MTILFDSVERLQGAMDFHRDRQALLAGNLANLDTPGYQPLDLARRTAFGAELGLAVRTTHARHLPATVGGHAVTRTFEDAAVHTGADGNGVNLERELAKLDANRVRYATSSELASRRLALLRYAAGDGI